MAHVASPCDACGEEIAVRSSQIGEAGADGHERLFHPLCYYVLFAEREVIPRVAAKSAPESSMGVRFLRAE